MCNLYVNSKIMPGLLYEITAIASVGVCTPYPRKCDDQHCQQSVCGFGIMNIGRSSGCFQNVSVLVCYYIALHAFDFLVALSSLLGTREGGTGTLTVDSSDSGLWRLASSKADIARYFPDIEELLNWGRYCTHIGFPDRFTQRILAQESVGFAGVLFSSEHNQTFRTEGSVAKLERNPADKRRYRRSKRVPMVPQHGSQIP